jgi:hypothetical protein
MLYAPGLWPTADGAMPVRLFARLAEQLDALEAGAQVRGVMVAQVAAVLATDPKSHDAQAAVRRMERRARPRSAGPAGLT